MRTTFVKTLIELARKDERIFLLTPDMGYSVLESFRDEFQDIIIKPLYGNGGQGVFHLKPNDENFYSILEMFFKGNASHLLKSLPPIGDVVLSTTSNNVTALNDCEPCNSKFLTVKRSIQT